MTHIRLLIAAAVLTIPQTKPSTGPIAKLVPAVPTPASFISDAAHVLNPADHTALDSRITAIQSAGLGDVAVAIMPSIGDYSPNQVAVEIYRTWRVGSMANVGSAHRAVGALILIVPKELAPSHRGECWINTGTGTEGIITDATAASICRDSIIPHLKEKNYAAALGAGIGAIEAKLRGDVALTDSGSAVEILPPSASSRRVSLNETLLGAIAVFLALLFAARQWLRYRPRKCPRCGRRMRRLDEKADDTSLDAGQMLEEKLGSVDYDVWVCECGEHLVLPHAKWFSRYSECRSCHRHTAGHTRTIIAPATTVSSGMAEDLFNCLSCQARWTQVVTLPRISQSSSSGGSSGGGGGGGSSFGGSGSTSGGGGGGSY